eukprot:6012234-Ditylum_brightwellii.AAC.2
MPDSVGMGAGDLASSLLVGSINTNVLSGSCTHAGSSSFVDRIPCLVCLRCPFTVASSTSIFLQNAPCVKSGHPWRYFLLAASSRTFLTGLNVVV